MPKAIENFQLNFFGNSIRRQLWFCVLHERYFNQLHVSSNYPLFFSNILSPIPEKYDPSAFALYAPLYKTKLMDAENEAVKKPSYPLKVFYCPECSLPLEYCEFMPEATRKLCKEWREKNTDLLIAEGLDIENMSLDDSGSEKKRQKRGGRGNVKVKSKKEPEKIKIARMPRGKKKFVTRVQGLASFDVNLKKASKLFSQKFSCGSSVSGDDEIIIQGDVTDDIMDLIPETWEQIEYDHLEDLGEVKK